MINLIKIIVDTNILFSFLLGKNIKLREILFSKDEYDFYSCKFGILELFKHKEKIIKYSSLNEDEILEFFYEILKRIEFYNEDIISNSSIMESFRLCKDIDEKDTLFVALTIELEGLFWTKDKKLKEGLIKKGFDRFFNI